MQYREVPEKAFKNVQEVLEAAWPTRWRWRVTDRFEGRSGSRKTAIVAAQLRGGERVLAFRLDPLERGRACGTPRFLVGLEVLRFAARNLRTFRFAVAAQCLALPDCRCRAAAGTLMLQDAHGRWSWGDGRPHLGPPPVPPLHAGCGCYAIPVGGRFDPELALELDRLAEGSA